MYALTDYHLTWSWPCPGSIPQRSRSHNTFIGQSTHARVCAITYVYIDGLPSNLVQMLSSLRRCAVTLTRIHTSKGQGHMRHLKVRVHMLMSAL